MHEDLSELAQRVGRHMAEHCVNGMPGHFDGDDLATAFPKATIAQLRTALAELKAEGFVILTPLIGPKLPLAQTTTELFAATDPAITGHDPVEDSVVLARMLVEDPKLGHVPSLEQASGWARRRFNPALGLLMPLFRKGRYREVIQPEYPTLGLIVGDDEVVALSRYIRDYTR